MEMVDLIAGIAWDPEIRGFLAVLTGVIVLMGSVWLVLTTNTGIRLGTLIAAAGFFGWMTIMATTWWMYGIGYAGDTPTWELVEIIEGDASEGHLTFAALDQAERLRSEDLPVAYELVVAATDDLIAQYGESVLVNDPADVSADELARIAVVRTARQEYGAVTVAALTPDQTEGLDGDAIAALAADEDAKNRATTLSELAAVAPLLVDEDIAALGGWDLLSTAESGEAQASAIAMILRSADHNFGSQSEFKILEAYTIGGKRGLPADPNRWDRISTQIRTALTPTHPTRYGIVQLRAVTAESLESFPGQKPPTVFADTDEPVISVVMIRNLGNLRFLPALVAIGSLLIFLALSYVLHERDKVVMARRAKFEAGAS